MTVVEVFWQLLLRLLLIFGGVIAIAYSVACIFLWFRQKYFIFKPPRAIRTTPEAFNLNYQEVWLPVSTASGQTSHIHGWWIPASAAPEAKVWLYLHGNGSNVGDEVKRAFWFHQLGFSTLLIDYRGYGRSEGKFPTESSVYEDVEAAWNYLTQVRHIPAEQIFLYGHSLGGAIAIDLALRHPNLAGLVVEGSFTAMRSMVAHLYRQFLIFPVKLLLHQRFDSLSKVRSLAMPILLIHGTADPVVPAHMSQALFTAATEPKKLLLVPEAGHHNVEELGSVQYLQAIQWVVEQAQTRQAQLAQR
jgi:alpha-beta hydrolase superfamily lysophospholipase